MKRSTKKINSVVESAENHQASDIHFGAGRKPVLRVASKLLELSSEPVSSSDDIRNILTELLSEGEMNRFQQQRNLDFSFTHGDSRFRCNAFFKRGTPAIAMRLISSNIPSLSELYLPSTLQRFTTQEQGFFLVVGPVGEGKSTTLAAMTERINRTQSRHILTIENPIEYVYEEKKSIIDQREVRVDTPDFTTALRSAFREDVDVILVGEMRGKDTMEAAVTAGETGHMVFATLHTNSAAETVNRILDTFPSEQQGQVRAQLASSLSGIFSQRLIPRISGGVIPAYELLINNKAVANLIRDGRGHEIDNIIQTSNEQGMISMNQSLADLVQGNEVELEDARHHSRNPQELERLLE